MNQVLVPGAVIWTRLAACAHAPSATPGRFASGIFCMLSAFRILHSVFCVLLPAIKDSAFCRLYLCIDSDSVSGSR
jgi:hypothetical protein